MKKILTYVFFIALAPIAQAAEVTGTFGNDGTFVEYTEVTETIEAEVTPAPAAPSSGDGGQIWCSSPTAPGYGAGNCLKEKEAQKQELQTQIDLLLEIVKLLQKLIFLQQQLELYR